MQISHSRIMDKHRKTMAMYKSSYLVDNNISEYGTLHLSKGNWKRLSLLHLSNNKIGNGFENLVKGNWKVLQRLFVSIYLKYNRIESCKLYSVIKDS